MPGKKVVSQEEWIEARKQLLAREKELTRRYDAVAKLRRELPWVEVHKDYVFEGLDGKIPLSDLFQGRSQLIVRHFMFGPEWEQGCIGCSFASDHVGSALVHLEHHDVSYAAVSRAPIANLLAYKKRMGWNFQWVSSLENDFNYDYHVSFSKEEAAQGKAYYNYGMQTIYGDEGSGLSVFVRDADGKIYHTYSCFGRGDETALTTYAYLDLTPKGRNETGPTFSLMDWVKRHDQYEPVLVKLG
jgi:predicted dithiol-disulfide oxidoreductase (DUF899 family)